MYVDVGVNGYHQQQPKQQPKQQQPRTEIKQRDSVLVHLAFGANKLTRYVQTAYVAKKVLVGTGKFHSESVVNYHLLQTEPPAHDFADCSHCTWCTLPFNNHTHANVY